MRSGGARVSHLARLAAVGLGLALGALQQRRRERLAARRVAARERGAARTGEEIKKLVRASADLVKTEGAGVSI